MSKPWSQIKFKRDQETDVCKSAIGKPPACGDNCPCKPTIHGVPLDKITDVRTLQERITYLEAERNRLKEQTPQQDDRLRAMNENQFNTIQELRTELATAKAMAVPAGALDTAANLEEMKELRAKVTAWKNGRDYYQTRYEELSGTLAAVQAQKDVIASELFKLKDGEREWDALIEDRNMFRDEAAFLHTHLDDRDRLLENARDLLREECIKGDELKARIKSQADTIHAAQIHAARLSIAVGNEGIDYIDEFDDKL